MCPSRSIWRLVAGNHLPTGAWVRSLALILLVSLGLLQSVFAQPPAGNQPSESPRRDDSNPSELTRQRDERWRAAETAYSNGELATAIQAGRETFDLERQIYGPDSHELLGTLEWLSSRCLEQIDLKQAEQYASDGLGISKQQFGEDDWRTVSARHWLDYLQRLAKAERRRLQEMLALAADYQRLYTAGNYREAAAKAETLRRHEAEVLGQEHPFYANTLFHLGDCYEQLQDAENATRWFRQALAIRRQQLGQHPDTGWAEFRLAKALMQSRKYAEAATLFHSAASMFIRLEQPTDAAWMYGWQGDCHREAGDDEAAVKAYAEAVRHFRELKHNEGLALNGDYLGKALKRLERFEDAAKSFQLAADAYEAQQDSTNAAWMHGWQGDCHRDAGDHQTAASAYSASIHRFQQLDHHQGLALNASNLGTALKRLERLPEAIEAFRTAARSQQAINGPDHWQTADARRAVADAERYATLTVAQRQQLADANDLEQRVLKAQEIGNLVELGSVEAIGNAVDTWRLGFGRSAASAQAGDELRKAVWEPVETVLANQGRAGKPVHQVLISPDGVLGRLPLGALPGKQAGTYLLENWPIATIPTPQALPRLLDRNGRQRPRGNVFVLGDVDYDQRSDVPHAGPKKEFLTFRAARDEDEGWSPLPGTKGELASIEKMYRDTFGESGLRSLGGAAASKSAVCREVSQHLFLHLAGGAVERDGRLQIGDQIVGVAQELGEFVPSQGKELSEVVELIRGRPGTKVRLQVKSGASDEVNIYELTRQGLPVTTSVEQAQPTRHRISGYHPGLLSGLALAGANRPTPEDDGILTAEEVATLDLSGVELAVLSACETGLGQAAGGALC